MKLIKTLCLILATMMLTGFVFAEEWNFKNGSPYDFEISNGWENGGMFDVTWRRDNVTFENGNMQLHLTNDPSPAFGHPYAGGEYRTSGHYGYGFYEVCMKPIKNDGVVSSFFTYTGPFENNPWDEIDIEFLGYDTTKVQFNYYTNGVGGNEYLHDLGYDASKEFHTYGFAWYADEIAWFVDGKEVYRAFASIPKTPSRIFMNVWAGRNVNEWLKPFNNKNLPKTAEYKWIKFTPFEGAAPSRGGKHKGPAKDSAMFSGYRNEAGNFALDSAFTTVNKKAMAQNTMNKNSSNWYALALAEFGGSATVGVEGDACHFTIQKPGKEVHSVQLLQHLGVAQGYKYTISFEAKAAKPRNISVKLGGDDDNNWAVYSEVYTPSLSTDYQKYEYTFIMQRKSDAQARLEFNLGTNATDVWIKNVKLTAE